MTLFLSPQVRVSRAPQVRGTFYIWAGEALQQRPVWVRSHLRLRLWDRGTLLVPPDVTQAPLAHRTSGKP